MGLWCGLLIAAAAIRGGVNAADPVNAVQHATDCVSSTLALLMRDSSVI